MQTIEPTAPIWRETDCDRVNAVVSHPRGVARVAFAGEHGCFVFLNLSDGLYEARGNVLASGRGRWAHAAAKEALRRMFEEEIELKTLHRPVKRRSPIRTNAVKGKPTDGAYLREDERGVPPGIKYHPKRMAMQAAPDHGDHE
jgi:hypothetical protein